MSCHKSNRSKVAHESMNMLSGYANSEVIPFLPSISHQNIYILTRGLSGKETSPLLTSKPLSPPLPRSQSFHFNLQQ